LLGVIAAALLASEPTMQADRASGRLGPVTTTALTGTGLALAPGPYGTLARRSPVSLSLDAAFRHPEFSWLEFSPAVLLELEGRVAFGLALRMRAYAPTRKFDCYVYAGVPAYVAPYTLLGAQIGIGFAFPIHPHVALMTEQSATVFFLGSDLTSADVMAKLDVFGGIRVRY
jgi:hypothetical protein